MIRPEKIRLGRGNEKKKLKALKITSRLVFSELFFLNICRTNSKTSKVNQQSVLNFKIFHHFLKNLDRTITFNYLSIVLSIEHYARSGKFEILRGKNNKEQCHSKIYTDRTSIINEKKNI